MVPVVESKGLSYLLGVSDKAANLPMVLYLKTPVVMIAAKFTQESESPQHAPPMRE